MKKRYFYVVVSFMRKDIANTWRKVDFTIMKDDGSSLFPLSDIVPPSRTKQYGWHS